MSGPLVSNVSPAVGTAIHATDPLSFEITDTVSFRRILIVADFGSIGIQEVIHDGDSFSQIYTGGSNARTAITDGFAYRVLRNGGWPASPRIIPYALDTAGDENP